MEQQTNLSTGQASGQPAYVVSKRNKKIGLFLLIGPFVGLIATLTIFAIVTFVISSIGAGTETSLVVAQIIRVVLGLFGIVCVIGIMVGIPLGIIFLAKKELIEGAKYDERSGKGEESIIPKEIEKWNWGAFFLTFIWGLWYKQYLFALLFLIPFLNFFVAILLGIKGNKWAWQSCKWESVEQFQKTQKKWGFFGFAIIVVLIMLYLAGEF